MTGPVHVRGRCCGIALAVLLAVACDPAAPGPEATSLLGESLYAPQLPADVAEQRMRQWREARARHASDPTSADAIIWLGRRIAYLGRYREAIAIFSNGIEAHPDDARMYRHRGHRYITVRELRRAVEDLEAGAERIEGRSDRVEPDGLPNARNIPTSTLHSNIWYHLGLAYYLLGDYGSALKAYERCQVVSANDDMRVATTYWHVMTLYRLGRKDEAGELLATVAPDLELIENTTYHRLLLLFKGELDEADVAPVGTDEDEPLADATAGYGIGFWHELGGRPDEAVATWKRTLEGETWAAFGYIASEAEIARRR